MKYGGAAMKPRLGSRSRQSAYMQWGLLFAVVALLSVYIYVMYATFGNSATDASTTASNSKSTALRDQVEQGEPKTVWIDPKSKLHDEAHQADPILKRKRRIILSTGHGKWNTGVWPAWGYGKEVTLNWAAAGVEVNKQCPVECEIVHEGGSGYDDADAVVMELTNHPKFGFGSDLPIAWPERRRPNPRHWYTTKLDGHRVPTNLPLTGVFYYEAAQSYPGYTINDEAVRSRIDFSMTPDQASTMPVSLICPWGRTVSEYLRPAPVKSDEHFIAYFNEHGVAPQFREIIDQFFQAAGDRLHSYGPHRSNRAMPDAAGGNPYQLTKRIDFMGTYKFILITEALEESSFVAPEWSHALLGGAVPVYIGAPNIATFAPGPRAYVDIRNFASGAELWQFLLNFEDNHQRGGVEAYQQWFDWKHSAKLAYREDEASAGLGVGTGEGVRPASEIDTEHLRREIVKWNKPVVEGLQAYDSARAADFHATGALAWRWFRVHLDRCVHYAECRLCELVTKLT